MTDDKKDRKEQTDIDDDFKNMFFNALKSADKEVSIDEDGFIVIPRRPHRKRRGAETDDKN